MEPKTSVWIMTNQLSKHFPVILTLLILLYIITATSYAATNTIDSESNLLPGTYKLSLIVFDPDERYPAELRFKLNDKGQVVTGTANYPTYNCSAVIKKATASNNGVSFTEEITVGQDDCSSMSYSITVNPSYLFKPNSHGYIKVVVLDDNKLIRTDQKRYNYTPTKYSSFRVKYKINGWDDISSSQNIACLNKYISLRNKTARGKKAHDILYSVVRKKNINDTYYSFIKRYPNSSHVPNAVEQMYINARQSNRLFSLFKQLKPILNNKKSIQNTYTLVKQEKDLKLLDEFHRQFSGHGVIALSDYTQEKAKLFRLSNKTSDYIAAYLLEKKGEDLVAALALSEGLEEIDEVRNNINTSGYYSSYESNTFAKAYRSLNTFPGYMRAYMLLGKQADLQKAVSLVVKTKTKSLPSYNLFHGHGFASANQERAAVTFFKIAQTIDTTQSYYAFIDTYPNSPQVNKAVAEIFNFVQQQNNEKTYLTFIQAFPKSAQAHEARNNILKFAKKSGDINAYRDVIRKFPDSIVAKEAIAAIFRLVSKKNTIVAYEGFLAEYPRSSEASNAVTAIFKLTCKQDTNEAYNTFIAQYPNSHLVTQAISQKLALIVKAHKYNIVKNKQAKIEEYKSFIANHPHSPSVSGAIAAIFNIRTKQNEISDFLAFLKNYPKSPEATKAISSIYKLVDKKRNIAGYDWFMNKFPYSPEAKQALLSMHNVAYEMAADIDTVTAYNDFIIAFPLAKEVEEANKRAYKIEKGSFTGTFKDEEKQAKSLLTLSKRIITKGSKLSSDDNIGYFLVANRMNDLLSEEFLGTEAALRYEESNERQRFQNKFMGKLDKLNRNLASINSNTSNLSRMLQSQSQMMNNHFEKAAQDRDMQNQITQQHRIWERTGDKYFY